MLRVGRVMGTHEGMSVWRTSLVNAVTFHVCTCAGWFEIADDGEQGEHKNRS